LRREGEKRLAFAKGCLVDCRGKKPSQIKMGVATLVRGGELFGGEKISGKGEETMVGDLFKLRA